jgi:hypothetical protein
MAIALELPSRPVKIKLLQPSHYDECVSCRSEQHSQHENKPNSAPIIVCAGMCKIPTVHRFSRFMGAGVSSAQHLIWACTACEGERVYGCVG